MRFEGALCEGSDDWFPTEYQHRERAYVAGLCRNECPAYRECLDFALSGVPLYGIVAGLNMAERTKITRTRPDVTLSGVCIVCGDGFEYVQKAVGRRRLVCSYFCRRRRANQATDAYRARKQFA